MELPLHPILEEESRINPKFAERIATEKGKQWLRKNNSYLHNVDPFMRTRVRSNLKSNYSIYYIYDRYLRWCVEDDRMPIDFNEFKEHMQDRYGTIKAPYYKLPRVDVHDSDIPDWYDKILWEKEQSYIKTSRSP